MQIFSTSFGGLRLCLPLPFSPIPHLHPSSLIYNQGSGRSQATNQSKESKKARKQFVGLIYIYLVMAVAALPHGALSASLSPPLPIGEFSGWSVPALTSNCQSLSSASESEREIFSTTSSSSSSSSLSLSSMLFTCLLAAVTE